MKIKRKSRLRKNPRDEELLKQVLIKKIIKPNWIEYQIILQNSVIATAYFRPSLNIVEDVYVSLQFRHRGLASTLYDYIEQDQDIKLKPSKDLLPDGESFWADRLSRRKNPKNEDLLKQLQIKKVLPKRGKYKNTVWYHIYLNNKHIGCVNYNPIKNEQHIDIKEGFKKQGIGTYVYDLIEKEYGVKLKPSKNISPEGKLFWKARLKRK